jgi:hypothetical protein
MVKILIRIINYVQKSGIRIQERFRGERTLAYWHRHYLFRPASLARIGLPALKAEYKRPNESSYTLCILSCAFHPPDKMRFFLSYLISWDGGPSLTQTRGAIRRDSPDWEKKSSGLRDYDSRVRRTAAGRGAAAPHRRTVA